MKGEGQMTFNLKKVVLRDLDKVHLGKVDNKPALYFNTCVVQGVGGDYFVSKEGGKLVLCAQDGNELRAYPASERGWSKLMADVIACYETDNEAARQEQADNLSATFRLAAPGLRAPKPITRAQKAKIVAAAKKRWVAIKAKARR